MAVAEMKLEAINQITNLDIEVVLKKVLALLRSSAGKDIETANLNQNYDAMKAQYGGVLQKLVQSTFLLIFCCCTKSRSMTLVARMGSGTPAC